MFEERRGIILGLTAAGARRPGIAAGRTALAEASRVCVTGHIDRRSLARAPDGALAPSPGIGPDEPASVAPDAASMPAPVPEARGPAVPNWSPSRSRESGGRRPKMGCPGRPVCGPGRFRRGAEGGSYAGRPGGTGRGPKRHAGTIGCAPFRGRRAGFPGAVLLAITIVIRSKVSISRVLMRHDAPRGVHGPVLRAPAKPLIYNDFWKFRGANPTVPAPGPARWRHELLLAITTSGIRPCRARGTSVPPATTPCLCVILPDS